MTENTELNPTAKEQQVTALAAQSEELTPEQKKQQAREKAPDTGLSDAINSKKQAKGALATDLNSNDTNEVLAAVATASAKPVVEYKQPPGSFDAEPKKSPTTSQAGWTAFSKLPNPGDEKALEALKERFSTDTLVDMFKGSRTSDKSVLQNDLLAQYLKDSYFGEWYHNAGCIMFTVFFTWLITKLGGGLMACLVVGAFLATYYQTSIRRLRRNVRDDIERELAINRLETDSETADWINHFVSRFWLIYEPVLSAQIIGIADAILIENTPSFLDSIRLSTFTLGTKPFRINSIKTCPRTEPNVVCMDWSVSFTPNDVLDMTQRDLQSKVNPKIVLTIRVGKGMIGAGMPVLLEDLAFSGKLRLKFKFFNEFPHVKTIEASFLEKPQFDYSLKPVGGETFGFDINNIPGLQSFIQEQVHATLGPMMYAPNVYTVDVAGMMAGTTDLTSANGVLAITIYSATNLKGVDLFGSLDPYVTFHVGNIHNAELARTTALEDTSNPKWDETHFVLLNSLNESLYLQVMDRNSGRKDASVGVASFDLKQVAESDNVAEGLNLVVLRSGKPVGEIKCDMRYFPVSKPDKKEDGTIIPAAESNTGVLRFSVHECKHLGGEGKSGGIGLPIIGGKDSINAYAIVKVNGKERLRTKVFKRSINPRWDKFVEIFVADKTKLDLSVTIMDSREFADDEVIGRWSSSLTNMEEEHIKNGKDWWHLKDGAGQIHLSSMWKPIVMTGFTEGLGHGTYRPPIGVVRVHFMGARGLKNVEGMGGKSDPYVRVLSGMQVRAQTDYVLDDLDPEWDTVLYVPIHSIREDLVFEVMDYNDISKDKSIGLCDFLIKDIVKETKTENNQVIYDALEPVDKWVDLTNMERKKGKGQLHYVASFIPIMEFEKPKKEKPTAEANKDAAQEAPATPPQEPVDAAVAIPEKEIHGEVVKVTEDRTKVDLLAYESGVLTVTIHEVKLPEKYRVNTEILLDSVDPQYRTVELKGNHLPFNETGDAFVKEMDFSKVLVRVRPVRDNDKEDDDIGHWTSSVRDIVRKLMERNTNSEEEDEGEVYKLTNSNGGTIRLSFKFTPVVKFKLDPRESLENQGNLTVTAIKANNLTAADRGGTSDPYVVFSINEVKLHKTEVYKKQLNPVFKNETFTVPVPNRIGVKLKASMYDWDAVGKDKLLGETETAFDGQIIESFAAKDVELDLGSGATLRLRLLWQPQLLARKRQGTSLLGSTTRIFTAVPGAAFGVGKDALDLGFGAGTKVLGTGGKVIGGGVSAIGSGIRGIGRIGKKSSDASSDSSSVVVTPPQPAPTQSSQSGEGARSSMESSTQRLSVADANGSREGTFNVSLLGARNLTAMDKGGTSDPYARVRYGSKVVYKTKSIKKTLQPEWNESFTIKVSEGRSQLDIKVKDKNTLNDVDIGDCSIDVCNVVQDGQVFDGWLPLEPNGSGEVHIRVEAIAGGEGGNGTRQSLFGKMMS